MKKYAKIRLYQKFSFIYDYSHNKQPNFFFFTHPFEPVVQSVLCLCTLRPSSVVLSLSRSVGSLSAQSQMEELTPGVNRSDFRELKMAEGTSLSSAF